MSISIRLDDGQSPEMAYRPGQRVSGKVIYNVKPPQEAIKQVTVEFRGKIRTEITVRQGDNRVRKTETIILFHRQIVLFSGPFTLQAQQMAWPFSFTFPKQAQYNHGHETSNLFSDSVVIDLPPSFCQRTSHFGYTDQAYVKYKLKAIVAREAVTKFNVTHEMPLSLIPVSPVMPQPTTLAKHKFPLASWQSRLLRMPEQKHTFSQKLAHVFTSNPELRTPSVAFFAHIHMPDHLAVGQGAPERIRFAASQLRLGPTDPESLTLELITLDLLLQGRAGFRVKRQIWKGSYQQEAKEIEASKSLVRRTTVAGPNNDYGGSPPIPLPADGTPVMLGTALELADFIKNVHSCGIRPDFSCWTIWHRHVMKVQATVRHKESGHMFKLEAKIPFEVLKPYLAEEEGINGAGVQAAAGPSELPANRDSLDGIELAPPAYGDLSDSLPLTGGTEPARVAGY